MDKGCSDRFLCAVLQSEHLPLNKTCLASCSSSPSKGYQHTFSLSNLKVLLRMYGVLKFPWLVHAYTPILYVDPSPVFQTPPTGLRHSLALAACNDGKVLAQLLKQEKMRYFSSSYLSFTW